jgi:HSP20 family molecular chaperone IbpA
VKELSFDDDFDEIFGESFAFNGKFMRRFQTELDEILDGIRNGKIKGTWEIRQINEPGVKGYEIQGRFGQEERPDPLEPLRPMKRRPLPEKPIASSETALKDTHEQLTDIFEEKDTIKIYVELPGEEKDDIKLSFKEGSLEIKAKNFHKMIDLPNRHLTIGNVTSEYKNGVLGITIPKKKEPPKKNSWEEKMV